MGKTALIVRYIDNKFNADYKATLGFEISVKAVANKESNYTLAIWDIAGQDQLAELRRSYIEGAQGAILVYDVTNRESFQDINFWIDQLYKYAGVVPFILVGNKIDLADEIDVTTEEGKKFANLKRVNKFHETSAKTGESVNEIFKEISDIVHKHLS